MDMENIDLIVGVHSIVEAIKNKQRKIVRLIATQEGWSDLKNIYQSIEARAEIVSLHDLQEMGKKIFLDLGIEYRRISSGVLLLATRLEELNVTNIYKDLDCGKRLKIFCLDQVTDVHNAAAILRTAAFFGVNYVLTAQKGSFGSTPSFAKIASGALEHVSIIKCSSLSKTITKLQEKGIETIGFTEHSEITDVEINNSASICLVVGAEDVGLSNAVSRVLSKKIFLKSHGPIKSLNVSVASAIAMERFFNF